MKNLTPIALVIITSLILSACTKTGAPVINQSTPQSTTQPTTESSPAPEAYTPTDPIEIFLVELTTTTKLPFTNPVKADIMWSEGENQNDRKFFFGDSFLIEHTNIGSDDEKVVADYFATNGFSKMKFNESVGADSHKVGVRKGDLICKYDRDQYPEETAPHLNIYCTDATKGTPRQ